MLSTCCRLLEREVYFTMEDYSIIGNSIARRLVIDGVSIHAFPGATLREMSKELDRPGVKLVISGIPDVMASRYLDHVDGLLVSRYEDELKRASRKAGVILCPFYPTRRLRHSQWGVINRLNQRICDLNAAKGEGTPALTQGLFGRANDGSGSLYFREERLADDAHPSKGLAEEMSRTLHRYIGQRRRRGRLSDNRPTGAEATDRKAVDERENDLEGVRQEREELREAWQRRETEIMRTTEEEMQKEINSVREEYRAKLHRRLDENDQVYRRQADALRGERKTGAQRSDDLEEGEIVEDLRLRIRVRDIRGEVERRVDQV